MRLILFSVLTCFVASGCATEKLGWPQFGGPDRDFRVPIGFAIKPWGTDGPTRLWSRSIGAGHSMVASDGRALFVTYRNDRDQEIVASVDPDNGQTIWERAYDAPLTPAADGQKHIVDFGIGPQSTPLVLDGRVYTVGFTGKLHCLDAATGSILWSHDLLNDFGGTFMEYGYSASPVAYRNLVILPVGGAGHSIMAFDRQTGRVVWKAGDFTCSHASPIVMTVGGRSHLVLYMASDVVGLSPGDGRIHWTFPHGRKDRKALCSPVALPGDRVYFVNDGFQPSSRVLQLSIDAGRVAVQELWSSREIKGGLFNPVRMGDLMYSQGNGRTSLMVFNTNTAKVYWHERGFERAKLVSTGRQLIVLDEEGVLMLGVPLPDRIEFVAKAKIMEYPAWAVPTLIGNRLFLRDSKNLVALELTPNEQM